MTSFHFWTVNENGYQCSSIKFVKREVLTCVNFWEQVGEALIHHLFCWGETVVSKVCSPGWMNQSEIWFDIECCMGTDRNGTKAWINTEINGERFILLLLLRLLNHTLFHLSKCSHVSLISFSLSFCSSLGAARAVSKFSPGMQHTCSSEWFKTIRARQVLQLNNADNSTGTAGLETVAFKWAT